MSTYVTKIIRKTFLFLLFYEIKNTYFDSKHQGNHKKQIEDCNPEYN